MIQVDSQTSTQFHDGRHGNNQSSRRTDITQRLTVVGRQRCCRPLFSSASWSPGRFTASSSSVVTYCVADRSQLRTQHPSRWFTDERQTRYLLTASTTADRRTTTAHRRQRWRTDDACLRRRRRSNCRQPTSVWKQRWTSWWFFVSVVLFAGILQFICDRQRGRIFLRTA